MALQTGGRLTALVDKYLTNFSSKIVFNDYIADKVLTKVPVTQNTGLLAKYGNQHLTLQDARLEGKADVKLSNAFSIDSDNYRVTDFALKDRADDQTNRNLDAPYNNLEDITLGLKEQLVTLREVEFKNFITDSNNYISDNVLAITSAAQRFDASTGAPLDAFRDARNALANVGSRKNLIAVMGQEAYLALIYRSDIRTILGLDTRFKGGASLIQQNELAIAMGVREVFVMEAAFKPSTSTTTQNILRNDIAYLVAPKGTARRQLMWGAYLERKSGERVFKNIPDGNRNSIEVSSHMSWGWQSSTKEAGYLIQGAFNFT